MSIMHIKINIKQIFIIKKVCYNEKKEVIEMNLNPETTQRLTKNEKKIVDYIFQNIQQFSYMSIQDLAKKTHISEATISRLPKHLGYQNYKDMKMNFIKDASPAYKMTSTLIHDHSIANYLLLQNEYIQKTIEHLNIDEFNQIVKHTIQAHNIYIFAKGATVCLADLLAFRLRRFKKNVIIIPSSGSELFEVLPMITNNDFVILFAFLKTPIEAQIVLEHCQKIKCPTMMMTSRLIDDSQKMADYNIYVYRGEDHEYHSMSVPMACIDALIVEIAKVGGLQYQKAVDDIYQLKENYKIKIQR